MNDMLAHILAYIFSRDFMSQLLDVLALLLVGLIIQQVLFFIASRFRDRLVRRGLGTVGARNARAKTITNVLTTTASIAGWAVLVIMMLDRLGVNIGPLLASAGVVGLAVSFGSQEMVKDFIAGFFFLLENQFNTGEVIEVKGKKGRVEAMSFRVVTLRDLETNAIHYFRNSLIDIVTKLEPNPELADKRKR